MIISFLGLIPYFTIILSKKGDLKYKLWATEVFLILGVQGAHSFANDHAAMRIQWMHPARPASTPGTWVLWLRTQTMWMGNIFVILIILFLGQRKKARWYLAAVGGPTTKLCNYRTHICRYEPMDYFLRGTFRLIILILMLIPAISEKLYDRTQLAKAISPARYKTRAQGSLHPELSF
jgi:hypothetical protein